MHGGGGGYHGGECDDSVVTIRDRDDYLERPRLWCYCRDSYSNGI